MATYQAANVYNVAHNSNKQSKNEHETGFVVLNDFIYLLTDNLENNIKIHLGPNQLGTNLFTTEGVGIFMLHKIILIISVELFVHTSIIFV